MEEKIEGYTANVPQRWLCICANLSIVFDSLPTANAASVFLRLSNVGRSSDVTP